MKIYKIVIRGDGTFGSEQNHYVMAEDFDEAYKLAQKRLVHVSKDWKDNAYVESISEQFELEVVK